ncbi:hypothetical protein RSSM_01860 [Rhodopirellula sallentina SM41]|uniref:Uncharacterized protein n=1 Tax=Rhodopirellula sallentina SM41 TaxID=1263870 RepID=M5UKZ2_9BACT|nr:hypothetical protein RSSM_01860 [Rhodopirellula sallentina SM41]
MRLTRGVDAETWSLILVDADKFELIRKRIGCVSAVTTATANEGRKDANLERF